MCVPFPFFSFISCSSSLFLFLFSLFSFFSSLPFLHRFPSSASLLESQEGLDKIAKVMNKQVYSTSDSIGDTLDNNSNIISLCYPPVCHHLQTPSPKTSPQSSLPSPPSQPTIYKFTNTPSPTNPKKQKRREKKGRGKSKSTTWTPSSSSTKSCGSLNQQQTPQDLDGKRIDLDLFNKIKQKIQ